MNYCVRFLAWKYLLGTKTQKSISIMLGICFTGIVIGSFSLALVLSIMNGFEKVTHEKLQSIHAQAVMSAYGDGLNMKEIGAIFDQEFPEIIGYSPVILKQALMQSDTTDETSPVVMIKAIDPARELLTSSIGEKITGQAGKKERLVQLVHDDQIVIGKKLAQHLDSIPGDQITILFAPDDQMHKRKITFNKQSAMVSGTFDTGIEDFDSSVVLCSFDLMQKMWPEAEITQINIKFDRKADEQKTIQKLRDRFNLDVYSWKDQYPALVSALKLEKYAMFFILALITLVASMNIISLQFMQVTQKRGDIAILKSMGMTKKSIVHIFLTIGLIITIIGSLTGLALAAAAGWLLATYPFISLPDVYYVTHLPVYMELHLFALVFCLVLFLGLIATWIPAHRTRSINIADVLRFDA